jgi:hypothetical protein
MTHGGIYFGGFRKDMKTGNECVNSLTFVITIKWQRSYNISYSPTVWPSTQR